MAQHGRPKVGSIHQQMFAQINTISNQKKPILHKAQVTKDKSDPLSSSEGKRASLMLQIHKGSSLRKCATKDASAPRLTAHCPICGKPIKREQKVTGQESSGMQFHFSCLKCCHCQNPLLLDEIVLHPGRIYCKGCDKKITKATKQSVAFAEQKSQKQSGVFQTNGQSSNTENNSARSRAQTQHPDNGLMTKATGMMRSVSTAPRVQAVRRKMTEVGNKTKEFARDVKETYQISRGEVVVHKRPAGAINPLTGKKPAPQNPEQSENNVESVQPDTQSQEGIGKCRAMFDYQKGDDDELGFKKGDTIILLAKDELTHDDWWFGRVGAETGRFPSNFVKLLP